MISFGKYLSSKERKQHITNHPEPSGLPLEDRLAIVNQADIDNWMESK